MVHDGISFNKKDILHNLTLFHEFQDGNVADWSLNGLPTLPIDYR